MRIPIIAAIILIIIGVAIDVYIYHGISAYHRKTDGWQKKLYGISAIVTLLFLFVALLMPRRNANADILPVMWMLYTWLTIYTGKLVYCIVSLLGKLLNILLHKNFNIGLYVGVPSALLVFGIMWWGAIVTTRDIEITEVQVKTPRLPAAFDRYRIVQISDLHVGTWGNDTAFISNLVDTVNSLRPDLVLFTGDIVNRQTSEIVPFLRPLSRLHAKDGVYSILGNHDYGDYMEWADVDAHRSNNRQLAYYQDMIGWKLLDNTHTIIHRYNEVTSTTDSIALIGVGNWGEPPFRHYADMKRAYPDTKDDIFKILLSHNPKHWKAAICDSTTIDLMLAGHTHAMQTVVRINDWKWSPSQWRYPEWGGLYTHRAEKLIQHLYVNIGAGEVGMPFRVGATPEVTVLTLRR